jgi:hypothetical protein
MLECPLNPPILGDFEVFSPQNWGAGGAQFDFCKRSRVVLRAENKLLPDTEATEDSVKHGFGDFFTCDFSQCLNRTSQVNCPKI